MSDKNPHQTKHLDQITKDEYLKYNWVNVTSFSDARLVFVQGRERTPEEVIAAAKVWHEWKIIIEDQTTESNEH